MTLIEIAKFLCQNKVMKLKIKRDEGVKDLPLPSYGRVGDAALDIVASEDMIVPAKQKAIIGTGVSFEIPQGQVGLVWDRSGMSFKHGQTVLGGVIDSNYRGELKVCLFNTTDDDYLVSRGDKIAQMVIQPAPQYEGIEVEELSETNRGEAGFGSSGK